MCVCVYHTVRNTSSPSTHQIYQPKLVASHLETSANAIGATWWFQPNSTAEGLGSLPGENLVVYTPEI